jgi:hypothetical protein
VFPHDSLVWEMGDALPSPGRSGHILSNGTLVYFPLLRRAKRPIQLICVDISRYQLNVYVV